MAVYLRAELTLSKAKDRHFADMAATGLLPARLSPIDEIAASITPPAEDAGTGSECLSDRPLLAESGRMEGRW